MNGTSVVATLIKDDKIAKVEGVRVIFSPYRCFAFDDGQEDIKCLRILSSYLKSLPGLALFGTGRFLDYLLKQAPDIRTHALYLLPGDGPQPAFVHDMPLAAAGKLPPEVEHVFLCETSAFPRMRMRGQLPSTVNVVDPTILGEIAPDAVPARAWSPVSKNIYPIDIPDIKFDKDLDLILIDCPSRNLALMPNGLGYVDSALKKTFVRYQIFDLDIVAYHRFHIHRLFDVGGRIVLPSGRVLPEDPWQAEHYDVWTSGSEMATSRSGHNDVIEFFRPLINETIEALVEARPKILGLSIQQCNEAISREVVRGVKARLPETVILVGGFSCYNADIGRRVFPECDYMCVGEADLTVGPLVEALARGERPANEAGVLSRYDTANYRFIPAPMVHNLDQVEFPKYEWSDLGVYRNYNDYQLTPIIASRGCRWSRCTFCAERFYWRIRSPQNFVDELQWLVDQGCYLFMFNESDLNGMPEKVMEICDEIIRRGLHRRVKLTGQLRIHNKSNRAFFEKLRAANFVALRFGVDAFSENTLRLQKKGYTVKILSQNLKDCWEAGIFTEVNWVIGVPGETEKDVDEGIELILKNRKYIGRLANINPLILVNGGVYWLDPEAHGIKFREPKEQLYAKYPRALPADSWFSVNPYIDAQVRKGRFQRIVLALHEAGFPVGAWATKVIEDVQLERDPNRAGTQKNAGNEFVLSAKNSETGTESRQIAAIVDEPDYTLPTQLTNEEAEEKTEGLGIRRKPAATPPLYGTAGEPPRLVRKLESHNIVFFNGWYYGIPRALASSEVDLIIDTDPSKLSGVIRHATEEGVSALIEQASDWANSRGEYAPQERQRTKQSYMRADSALGETEREKLPAKPRIFRVKNGEYVAIGQDVITNAFDFAGFGSFNSSRDAEEIQPTSPMRRLAKRLPPSVWQKLRRIVREQSVREGKSTALQPDHFMMGLFWRGTINAYIKKPLKNITRGKDPRRSQKGVKIDGENFSIFSVVTKNALPELMWSMDRYNVVKYDGMFFGLPHGIAVDWEADDPTSIRGVVTGSSIKEVVAKLEVGTQSNEELAVPSPKRKHGTGPAGDSTQTPVLLGSLEGYNVVAYEGWVYGIPQDLGPMDLTEVDAIEMPEVIRDVSRDVVENEILDRVKFNQTAVG